jgi:hypothetical protein
MDWNVVPYMTVRWCIGREQVCKERARNESTPHHALYIPCRSTERSLPRARSVRGERSRGRSVERSRWIRDRSLSSVAYIYTNLLLSNSQSVGPGQVKISYNQYKSADHDSQSRIRCFRRCQSPRAATQFVSDLRIAHVLLL